MQRSEPRQFCRFNTGTDPVSIHQIPREGFCLSTFLVIRPRGVPDHVLLGKLEPSADWARIGGLDPERIQAHKTGWMLPACQLLYGEGPEESATRILEEQLPGLPVRLEGPRVFSEVYAPKRFPDSKRHWDLHFIFKGEAASSALPPISAWATLSYRKVGGLRPTEFARGHEDILALAGIPASAGPAASS